MSCGNKIEPFCPYCKGYGCSFCNRASCPYCRGSGCANCHRHKGKFFMSCIMLIILFLLAAVYFKK